MKSRRKFVAKSYKSSTNNVKTYFSWNVLPSELEAETIERIAHSSQMRLEMKVEISFSFNLALFEREILDDMPEILKAHWAEHNVSSSGMNCKKQLPLATFDLQSLFSLLWWPVENQQISTLLSLKIQTKTSYLKKKVRQKKKSAHSRTENISQLHMASFWENPQK